MIGVSKPSEARPAGRVRLLGGDHDRPPFSAGSAARSSCKRCRARFLVIGRQMVNVVEPEAPEQHAVLHLTQLTPVRPGSSCNASTESGWSPHGPDACIRASLAAQGNVTHCFCRRQVRVLQESNTHQAVQRLSTPLSL